ncbi:hypothetical protein CAPTEDRAFT_193748 [Capitella teleta]|uniref:Uncharacterized protein n=1 Tax=Capitella teleta TaxID=283909 RepID=R7V9L9_CAPTE|nr:hypothetical protein CAPTEDRAFT_193748 [Capitella teleta]|eukprot:ELU15274.1 hypothetical protein CAPTEDRAFT_193748 [Capitella teleta]
MCNVFEKLVVPFICTVSRNEEQNVDLAPREYHHYRRYECPPDSVNPEPGFSKGQRWISELDTCFISPEYISAITSFEVHQTPLLPSDQAPINLNINREKCRSQPEDLTETLLRAENLHSIQTATSAKEEIMQKRKPIRMHEIDQDMICEELRGADTPALEPFNPDQIAEDLNEILYTNNSDKESPSDEAFKEHFEKLLKPDDAAPIDLSEEDHSMYLPATDEPIQPFEVDEALKSFKPNKSGGPSGIPPGFLKMLPVTWVTFLAHLFIHRNVFRWKLP